MRAGVSSDKFFKGSYSTLISGMAFWKEVHCIMSDEHSDDSPL